MMFYQIWMDLKESMNTSYYTSFIYLSIGAILNTSPLLEIYLKIADNDNYDQNQLYLILGSLNVSKYMLNSSILHSIYIVIIFCFNTFIIILFMILYYLKKYNVQTNIAFTVYGQIIGYLIQPYFWSINGFLLQIQNTYWEQIQNLAFILLDFIAIVQQLLFLITLILFLHYDHSQKKNFLKINSPKTLIFYIITIFFNSFLELFINSSDQLNIAFPIVLVILYLLLFTQIHLDLPVFQNKQINNYFQIIICIQFALALNLLVSYFINFFEDRYCLQVILTFILLIQLNSKIRQYLIFRSINNYSVTRIIDQKTIEYLKQNSEYLLLLRGIVQMHQSLCSNINCFYRSKFIYKISSKGNKKILINRDSIYDNIGRISNFFLKCSYETMQQKSQDQSISIQLIELLCYKLKLYSVSLTQIDKLNEDKLNLFQQINIMNIKLIISRLIKQKNEQAYKSKLPFDHLLQCESYIKETVQIIINIFGYQQQFWNYLLNEEIRLIDELIILQKISRLIKKFQELQKQILNLHYKQKVPIRNRQWFNYFFFKLFILNKKLKLQDLEILPDFQLNLDQILKDEYIDEKSSDEEPINYYQQKFLISGNTFIIQINQSCIVKNCTNNTFQILNYNKQSLVNSSAVILMPQMFKQCHYQFINYFQQTGQSYNLYKRKKAFCIHDQGYIITVYKYLKYIYNYTSNQIEYIAMFRQIQTKQQYLLLNEDWEIDSCTQFLQDIIGIKSLSLFILAPKTIVFSEYEKFLTKENKEFFSLNAPNQDQNLSQLFYTQPSMIRGSFSSSNGQNSNLLKQDEIQRSYQNFLNFDDVINIKDQQKSKIKQVLFNLRVPKQKYELVQEFQTKLSELYKQALYTELFKRQLIVKNQFGKYQIVKSEFIRRCKIYQEIIRKEKFKIIKELFQKYTQSEECIDKILRIEGTLKLEKTLHSVKYILIKIVRTELIKENQKSYQQNCGVTLSFQTPLCQLISSQQSKRSTNTQLSPRRQYVQTYDQFDLYSNRESIGKVLLPELQVNQDFDQNDQNKNINFITCNSDLLKEDTNKIEKYNPQIVQYEFISRLIFILQILIVFLSFFFTSFIYNQNTIVQSVNLVDYLYEYQIIVAESYNAQIDIELFNRNYTYQDLTKGDSIGFESDEQFYEYQQNVTQKCGDYMYFVFLEPKFLKMLYENFYSNSNESGLDIQTVYQVNVYLLNMLSSQKFKEDFGISETFRKYMLIQWIIYSIKDQDSKKFLIQISYYFLYYRQFFKYQICYIQLDFNFKYRNNIMYNLLKFLKVLFKVQAMIPYREKVAIIEKISTSINQFYYVTNNEYGDLEQFSPRNKSYHSRQTTLRRKSSSRYGNEKSILDIEKKHKEKSDNKSIIKFQQLSLQYSLKKIVVKIILNLLLITLISIAGVITIYYTLKNIELFNKNQFMFNTQNAWVLPAIKEIFTSQKQVDYNFNDKNAQIILQFYFEQISSEYPVFYESNIDEIYYLFDNNICNRDNDIKLEKCELLINGALTRGIREYDYLLSKLVQKVLNPNDERYENITYSTIYQFNKLYYFVFDYYTFAKDIWVKISIETLEKHDQVSLILLNMPLFYNIQ
ncbi:unnamed protein product [Paramecium primaurelia]|uniref:Transmembrane protein n=1 Tax=Paramecium primaurelia TaxID=5886 RepID=A0A8S1N7L8_PARPR|nr:unnamed protein product [Paramecium primaurelia]